MFLTRKQVRDLIAFIVVNILAPLAAGKLFDSWWVLAGAFLVCVSAWVLAHDSAQAKMRNGLLVYKGWPRKRRVLSCALALIIAILVLLGVWWAANHLPSAETKTEPKSVEVPPPPSLRVKYSSSQTIEWSNAPGDYNESLNLDNVATLVYVWEADRERIQLAQGATPPFTVKNPKAGERYPVGPGMSAQLPATGQPGMEVRNFKSVFVPSGAKTYTFSRTSPINIVEVGERRFRVTLQEIVDKSGKKQKLIVYRFGISEE